MLRKPSAVKRGSGRRELIWERMERRATVGAPAITVDRIVRLAMDLADREGLDAISMRRIAAELNSGVMSLYYHVPGKEDLLDLLLDTTIGEIEIPEKQSGDWQRDLRLLAVRTRACLKRHAWLPVLLNGRATFGPNRFTQTEYALSVVSGLGLNIKMMWRVIGSLYVYVLGFVALELSEGLALRQKAGFERLAAPYLNGLFAAGKFPNVARYYAAGCPAPPNDEAFEGGLDLVLQGIAAAVRKARRGDRREPKSLSAPPATPHRRSAPATASHS